MNRSDTSESSRSESDTSIYVAQESATADLGLDKTAGGADLADQGELDSETLSKHVEVRGTRRRQMATLEHNQSIKNRLLLPHPRRDGSSSYLLQALLTSIPLAITDLVALLVSLKICDLIGLEWLNPLDASSLASVWLPPVILAFLLVNAAHGLYPGTRLGTVEEMRRLWLSITITTLITASSLRFDPVLFWKKVLFLVVAYFLCMLLAPYARSRMRRLLGRTSWWGFPTLVCGNDAVVFRVCAWLADNRRLGLRPVAIATSNELTKFNSDSRWEAGSWENARDLSEKHHAYGAVFVESPQDTQHITELMEEYLGNIPHVFVVSELTGIPDHWNHHQLDEGLPGFKVEQHLLLPIPQLIKRGLDIFIATLAGLALAPLFAVLAIAIKLTSPGPIFFGHERVGRGNTRFRAWKFRTMVQGAEGMIEDYLLKHPELRDEWNRDHKLKNDPRVTKLGKFMRKWSIDELPQIWNVLAGEMSIVGPRPIVPNEIETYGTHFEAFCSVLPGMTGLWQVCGRNNTTFDVRIQLGLYYIHHRSLWLDLYLIAKTIRIVLFAKGAY